MLLQKLLKDESRLPSAHSTVGTHSWTYTFTSSGCSSTPTRNWTSRPFSAIISGVCRFSCGHIHQIRLRYLNKCRVGLSIKGFYSKKSIRTFLIIKKRSWYLSGDYQLLNKKITKFYLSLHTRDGTRGERIAFCVKFWPCVALCVFWDCLLRSPLDGTGWEKKSGRGFGSKKHRISGIWFRVARPIPATHTPESWVKNASVKLIKLLNFNRKRMCFSIKDPFI